MGGGGGFGTSRSSTTGTDFNTPYTGADATGMGSSRTRQARQQPAPAPTCRNPAYELPDFDGMLDRSARRTNSKKGQMRELHDDRYDGR